MGEKRVPFGPWTPDLPRLVNSRNVIAASGCVPHGAGYGPMKSLEVVDSSALGGRPRGSITGTLQDGTPYNFAGDETDLYRLEPPEAPSGGGWTAVSKSGGYNANGTARWAMGEFAGIILAADYHDATQYFDLGASQAFADIDGAPRARHIGIVGVHAVLGNTYDTVDGPVPERIWWHALGNPLSWPTPGSDLARSVQSDRTDLEGSGGWVQAVVDGAEVGAIFQERATWRMDYRGGDVIYELNRVEPRRGLLVPGMAIPYGREVLFLAEDGWYIFDYTQSRAVGEEKINRTFMADIDTAYFDRWSWVKDPDRPIIYVAYPGSGNTAGRPNKILAFNYYLRRFSEITLEVELLAELLELLPSLDSTPPDTPDNETGSWDDRQMSIGAAIAGAFNSSRQLSKFSGSPVAATIETGDIEHYPGRRAFVDWVRPLVDGATSTVQVASRARTSESSSFGAVASQERDGACRVRAEGRYHQYRVNIAAGADWESAIGVDVGCMPTGRV